MSELTKIEEDVLKREKQLKKHLFHCRLIYAIVFVLFLALVIIFTVLRESSKEVIKHGDDVLGGFLAWDEVNYNEGYTIGIMIGLIGSIYSGIFLLVGFFFCDFRSVAVNGNTITVYRGMFHRIVYVNGEKIAEIEPISFEHVIDTVLPDGVKASISFYRSGFHLAHISFSDHNFPIDL